MMFFALKTTARGQGNYPALPAHRPSESASLTSNTERARPRSQQDNILPKLSAVRVALGDLFDVEENAGGREPPGRNAGRYS